MSDPVIFIKINESHPKSADIVKRFEKSFCEEKEFYYNLNDRATKETSNLQIDKRYFIAVLLHSGAEITNAYLGSGYINIKEKGKSIKFLMISRLSNDISLRNICKLSELNLNDDFGPESFLLCVDSELVSEQINTIINTPRACSPKMREYQQIYEESLLHPLAQKNEYCRRQYNLRDPMSNRSEFQRDYERIVHSKAFRRMVDKAQVFSAAKGDYYRTRMTHSQVVAQIGRAITAGLKLNLYLTEAIALGHDIGHTPFGHQGERTLDDILRGKHYNIIQDLDLMYPERDSNVEGFKHNYQSVRVAAVLEEKYAQIPGMDLSFQTLEGMLKHTKLKRDIFSLRHFVGCDESDLHFDQDFCSTLEGQVVAIADEIAQRGHDLDDALTSGAISFEEFQKYLTLKKMDKLSHIVENVNAEIAEAKSQGIKLIDESELRNSRIVSAIVSYFVGDVIDYAKHGMTRYSIDDFQSGGHIVTKRLIAFSEKANELNNYLETIISNRVINNPEISLFDSNAATIVSGLFKAYYDNPRLLHKGTKRKLYLDIRKVSQNVIDFESGNHILIKEEFERITRGKLADFKIEDEEKFNEYSTKRKILIRNICDYISGMTDTYAINEYNRIVK